MDFINFIIIMAWPKQHRRTYDIWTVVKWSGNAGESRFPLVSKEKRASHYNLMLPYSFSSNHNNVIMFETLSPEWAYIGVLCLIMISYVALHNWLADHNA